MKQLFFSGFCFGREERVETRSASMGFPWTIAFDPHSRETEDSMKDTLHMCMR